MTPDDHYSTNAPGQPGKTPDNSEASHLADATRTTAHDIKNLFGLIVTYCSLIDTHSDTPSAINEDLDEIRAAAQRGIALADQFQHNDQMGPP